ncbi:hypothetical protein COO64_18510 [Pseudomonas donghuensis]|nr:hypothetical protein COO64_18510 [Pseudomonas donghuensis]
MRTELFDRVWRMVDAASADSQLRAKLFRLAGHPRTCGNSIALNFSYLEIQVQVFQALSVSESSQVTARLLRLGQGLFRLDKLDKVVLDGIRLRRESTQGRWRDVEEVEVSLGYRVRLAEVLDLPGQPSAMLFPDLVLVRLVAPARHPGIPCPAQLAGATGAGAGRASGLDQRCRVLRRVLEPLQSVPGKNRRTDPQPERRGGAMESGGCCKAASPARVDIYRQVPPSGR